MNENFNETVFNCITSVNALMTSNEVAKDDKAVIKLNYYQGTSTWRAFLPVFDANRTNADYYRTEDKATAKHFWQEGNDPWNECVIVTSPEVKKPVALPPLLYPSVSDFQFRYVPVAVGSGRAAWFCLRSASQTFRFPEILSGFQKVQIPTL